jgi:uncharacterized membrane protein YjfL (UPF0719 family)
MLDILAALLIGAVFALPFLLIFKLVTKFVRWLRT